jgi:hypothetical protein
MTAVLMNDYLVEDHKKYLETCLVSPHSVLAYRQQEFRASVARYGLSFAHTVHHTPLIVPAHSTITLSTTSGAESKLTPHICSTNQFDQFKAWIGFSDEDFEKGILPTPELPSSPWQHQTVPAATALTPLEKQNIQVAGFAYLFGHSSQVESYKTAIETLHAPFEAVVYAIERVSIAAGGCLVVQGDRPAIILINELEIIEGGHITLHSPTTLTVQLLKKHSLNSAI